MFKIFILSFVSILFITFMATELGLYGEGLISIQFSLEETLGFEEGQQLIPTDSDAGFGIGPLINAFGVVINTLANFIFGIIGIILTVIAFVLNVAQLTGLQVEGIPNMMNFFIILPLNFAFLGSLVMIIRGNS